MHLRRVHKGAVQIKENAQHGFKWGESNITVLVNRRSGEVLAEHVEIAQDPLRRGIGLMFRSGYDGAMIFPRVGKASFHGFFCRFPILLVCLDGDNRVKAKKILKPWAIVSVDCETAIELDARRNLDIKIGDELVWNENRGKG